MTAPSPLTGGQLIVQALAGHGVTHAFSVAGESFLEILDALVDQPSIQLVTCRQEGGAAFMAEAVGKLTGRPAVLLVTRGPGACNAAIGIHTAHQDSTPMVVIVGQVARHQVDREAFQEVDYRKMFAPLAKWVTQIDQAERIPELMSQAFHVATSGRPGPVVVAVPEDMLRDRRAAAPAPRYRAVRAHPGPGDLAELERLIAAAERPIVLVGGSGWTDWAAAALRRWLEAAGLPACCSFRRQDVLDNRSPSYVGDLGTGANPALVARVREADLVVALGARLGEITTQSYGVLAIPEPRQRLVHIHPSAEEIGRVFHPTLGIQAGMPELMTALDGRTPPRGAWQAWAAAARADYEATLVPAPAEAAVDLGQIMVALRQRLPADAVITIDAGNHAGWTQRFLAYGRPGRQLGPTSGAMGYAVPAAVGAKIAEPHRLAVACVGDGGFMMTGQELATALQNKAPVVVLLFNNGMYGTIRMHQERRFPGRVSGTDLTNPDFVALARAYGAYGARVAATADFVPAWEAAVASGGPAILEIMVPPDQITTRATIADLRAEAARRAKAGAEADHTT